MTESPNTQTWKVTLLTPLHLGDGIKLQNNVDYISGNGNIDVIDFDGLAEQLADIPKAINDLSQNIRLDQIIRDYRLSVQPMYAMKCTSAFPPKEIRSFLKNAYGEPYLAGSSLKGAIHTALWTGLDRTGLPSPRVGSEQDYKAGFKKFVGNLGGNNPYHMFIRPLQVSDSMGLKPQDNIVCEEIKFFNLQWENQPGWKDFGSKSTKNDFRQAAGMHVETLRPNTELILQVHIDPLLAKDGVRKAAGIVRSNDVTGFDRLVSRISAHSKHIAEREKAFFDRYKPVTRDVVLFYDKLIRRIDETAQKTGAFIIRLAWGSGWRGMTGDWIEDEDMAFLRDKKYVKLGKVGAKTFPKTRRLAIDPTTGTPSLPLGWVLVEPVEAEAFRLKPASAMQPSAAVPGLTGTAAQIPPHARPEPPEPADPEVRRREQLARFQQRIQRATTFQGEVGQLIALIKQEPDNQLKQEMAAMLVEKAQSLPNKAYATARKNDKPWAKMIDELTQEVS